jgi:hypothetical protein
MRATRPETAKKRWVAIEGSKTSKVSERNEGSKYPKLTWKIIRQGEQTYLGTGFRASENRQG